MVHPLVLTPTSQKYLELSTSCLGFNEILEALLSPFCITSQFVLLLPSWIRLSFSTCNLHQADTGSLKRLDIATSFMCGRFAKSTTPQSPVRLFCINSTYNWDVAHIADIFRLQLIRDIGGVYLDIDVISLKSFDPLRHHEFVIGEVRPTYLFLTRCRRERKGCTDFAMPFSWPGHFLNLWSFG